MKNRYPRLTRLGLTAGLLYLGNPFAAHIVHVFVPGFAVPPLASDLGAIGHPFAWVFNLADCLSGLLTLALCGLLWKTSRSRSPFWRWSLYALGAEAVFNTLSALFPLPDRMHTPCSYADTGGLFVSTCGLALHKIRTRGRKRWFLPALVVGLSCALYLLIHDASWDGIIQRCIICETAGWIWLCSFVLPSA